MTPFREIRARFDDRTLTVYQAYPTEIADAALAAGRFVPPFKVERMTWIKPSFLWMMYRSGWGTKPGQERVLSVSITRAGFDWALANSSLSHHDPSVHRTGSDWAERKRSAPVRVQWDPERSLQLEPLPYRAIQVGLGGEAVRRYVTEWTVAITDLTPLVGEVSGLLAAGAVDAATSLLPAERPYPLTDDLRAAVGAG